MKTSVTLVTFVLTWGILSGFGVQFGIKGMIGLGFAVLIAFAVRDYLEAGELEEGIAKAEEFTNAFALAVDQLEKANELIEQTVTAIDMPAGHTSIPILKMRDYLDKLKELPHEKI